MIKFLKRYAVTFVIVFFPIFMIGIFGPTEIFFGNYVELGFVYGEFGWKFLGVGMGITAIFALLFSQMPDVVRKVGLGILTGLSVAAYAQSMFLNSGLGQIGVTAEGYVPEMSTAILNAVIWLVIIGAVMGIVCRKSINYDKVLGLIAGCLLMIQLVAFGTLFLNAEDAAFHYQKGVLSLDMEEQFTVSGKENVIVLLFDNVPNVWLDEAREVYPDLLDGMKDFTYYTNADCNYYGTYPSIAHILTGNPLNVELSVNEYLAESWDNSLTNAYYQLLEEKNYKVNVFMYQPEIILGSNSFEILDGKVSNVKSTDDMIEIDYELLYRTMLEMSLYRYVPAGLKPEFYVSNEQYASIVFYPDNTMAYSNPNFYNGLLEKGLTINNEKNYFVFNHLNGSHEFINDENCQYAEEPSREQTIKGMFVLVNEYLMQLQEAGVYDNSTIIIMTDHGAGYNAQPIFFIKEKHEVHDMLVENNAPITFDEFVPTIVKGLGEDPSLFGQTIYNFEQNELRERVFYDRAETSEYPAVKGYDGTRAGRANVWVKYTYIGDRTEIERKYLNGEFEYIPMVDCYY